MKSNSTGLLRLFSLGAFASFLYSATAQAGTEIYYGAPVEQGDGTIRTYIAFDGARAPLELGVLMSTDSVEGLPAKRSTTGRCFDMNGNGRIDAHDECEGDHEVALALPAIAADRPGILFQWVAVNWNVEGHIPPGIYDLPHFDFHFYLVDQASVRAIGVGRCGVFIDCGDFERATKPVPAKYVHHDHVSVGAAVAAMGNHLIDTTSHEFAKPPRKFDHTWIFGAYDGHITFYEPMITREFIMSLANVCAPIKQPNAWKTSGYYPTRYCIRYHDRARKHTVSLEGFEYRKAE